jgi:hypothetical protein
MAGIMPSDNTDKDMAFLKLRLNSSKTLTLNRQERRAAAKLSRKRVVH